MTGEFYYIKTYGCQMNVHESEKLAGMLKELGYTETNDEKQANVIVFNTCCIRDSAEKRIFGNVGAVKNLKKTNPNLIVAICGCMSQVEGKANFIKEKYPYVNIVFGTHNISEFKNYIQTFKQTKKNVYDVWGTTDVPYKTNSVSSVYRTSGLNAWVNIMYGCNNFCSYCIVPFVRGRERSRSITEIVTEVTDLVNNGYKTITLLGQNVNSYGNDLPNENLTFAKLLETLSQISGDFRLKFMTSHPKDLTDDVINVIAKNNKISKAIHLPVQSGSNKILELMNRKYTREHYLNIVNKIKALIPNYSLSTDIIVGFPHETEEDFNETYSLVEDVQFDGVYGFMYSKRQGTVAEKMDSQIDLKIKNERVNKLLALSKNIIKERNKQLVGKTLEVLIEKQEDNNYIGITDSGKNVIIELDNKITLPAFAKVQITGIIRNKLTAKII